MNGRTLAQAVALGATSDMVQGQLTRGCWTSLRRGVYVALLTAALPYTHYWGIYLVAAVGLVLALGAWRMTDPERRRAVRTTLLAVVAGAVIWAPWLPVFRYQSQRTATPWTEHGDLLDILDTTFRWNRTELAGGLLLMVVAAAIIAALAYGRPVWKASHLPRWASNPGSDAVITPRSGRHACSRCLKRCEVGSNVEKSAGGISPTSIAGIAAKPTNFP